MRRSPRFFARRLLAAACAPLLFVLATACGNSPRCDTARCGTGGATGTSGTGGAGGSGGAGGQLSPTFPCKQTSCMRGAEVCDVTTIQLENATGACGPLPAACKSAAADCACFGDLEGCTCLHQPTGEFDVFCDKQM